LAILAALQMHRGSPCSVRRPRPRTHRPPATSSSRTSKQRYVPIGRPSSRPQIWHVSIRHQAMRACL